jgi:hypothetical protein
LQLANADVSSDERLKRLTRVSCLISDRLALAWVLPARLVRHRRSSFPCGALVLPPREVISPARRVSGQTPLPSAPRASVSNDLQLLPPSPP